MEDIQEISSDTSSSEFEEEDDEYEQPNFTITQNKNNGSVVGDHKILRTHQVFQMMEEAMRGISDVTGVCSAQVS